MNIHIIGAGAVGLSTALALARAGHQVTVLEGRTGPAQGASFAPGGLDTQIPPALWPATAAWSLPFRRQTSGFPAMAVPATGFAARRWAQSRHKAHAALIDALAAEQAATAPPPPPPPQEPEEQEEPAPAPQDAGTSAAPAGPAAIAPPADESADGSPPSSPKPPHQSALSPATSEPEAEPSPAQRLARQMCIEPEYECAQGHLIVAADSAQARRLQQLQARLRQYARSTAPDLAVHWLDAAQLAESEPGLNPDARPVAALRLPSDEVGNCRQLLM
ncbi:MAG: FAD-dependent oxidoreductase, partial [Comamonas sp.]